jgi:hypothetical protein
VRLKQHQRWQAAMLNGQAMNAAWKIVGLAALVFLLALAAARLFVPDVVPIGYRDEPQPSWAVLTAFVLRAVELVAAWIAAIAIVVMCGASARRWLRRCAR